MNKMITFVEEGMAKGAPFSFTASSEHEREMVDHLREAGWRVEEGHFTDFAWYCYPPGWPGWTL